jgi:hypothetical protein
MKNIEYVRYLNIIFYWKALYQIKNIYNCWIFRHSIPWWKNLLSLWTSGKFNRNSKSYSLIYLQLTNSILIEFFIKNHKYFNRIPKRYISFLVHAIDDIKSENFFFNFQSNKNEPIDRLPKKNLYFFLKVHSKISLNPKFQNFRVTRWF